MLGLPALVGEALLGSTRVTGHIPYAEAGLVYGCVAGLLNVLAMIDVYGWAEAQVLGLDPLDRGSAPAKQPTRSAADAGGPPDAREEVGA